MRIRLKLLVIYLGVALIPLFFLGAVSYNMAREALITESLANLDGTASRLTMVLEDLAERDIVTATDLANEDAVKAVLAPGTDQAVARAAMAAPESLGNVQRVDPNLRTLLVLDLDGKVAASTDSARVGEAHSGTEAFELGKVAPTGNLYFKDKSGDTLLQLSAPVYVDGTLVGVVVDEHFPKIVLQMTGSAVGLGATGEILVVKKEANGDAVFVMPTRFDQNAAFTRKISKDDGNSAMIKAFNGAPGVFTKAVDYRGKAIFASSRYVEGLRLGVEVKIDREEALAPLSDIALGMLTIILLVAAYVLFITLSVARAVAGPLVSLTNITKEISLGKLNVKFDEADTEDEVGDLYRSFERILISLKLAMRETGKDVTKDKIDK